MKNLLIILAAFLFIGCSSTKTLTQTTDDVYNQGINYAIPDTVIQQPSTTYYPSEDAYTAPQITLYVDLFPDYPMWSPYWYVYSYPYYYSPWYYGYTHYNHWYPYYGFYAPPYYPYGNYWNPYPWNYNHHGWYGHHPDGYYYGRRTMGTTPQPNHRNYTQPPQQRTAPKPQPKYQRTQTYSSPAYRQAKSSQEYMRTVPAPRNIQENQKVTPSSRSILTPKPMEWKNAPTQRNYNTPKDNQYSQPQRVKTLDRSIPTQKPMQRNYQQNYKRQMPSQQRNYSQPQRVSLPSRSIAPNNFQRQSAPSRQSPQNMRR